MNYFQDQLPSFVSVHEDTFKINQQRFNTIQVMIQKIQPIRKLFRNGRLICYSMDAAISLTQNKYCIFCDDAHRCHRKLRLSMIWLHQQQMTPIVFDLNRTSFRNLEELINDTTEEALKTTPVTMKIVDNENDQRHVEFST